MDNDTGTNPSETQPKPSIIDCYVVTHDSLKALSAKRDAERDAVLATIAVALAEVDAKFADVIPNIEADLALLESLVRQEALAARATVSNERLSVLYVKGRVSWDSKALDGYAAAYPLINQFRKAGEPTTSLRWVKAE